MRRAAYEFHRVLGDDYQIVEDAVVSEPRFITLFGEYNKYILRRLAYGSTSNGYSPLRVFPLALFREHDRHTLGVILLSPLGNKTVRAIVHSWSQSHRWLLRDVLGIRFEWDGTIPDRRLSDSGQT